MPGEASASGTESSGNGSIEVLHVDDAPGFAEMAGQFLERHDERFVVETATGVEEALELLDSERFDCVVSDYEMPERNGIEFLETVRERFGDLPFVLFTGKGSEEVASEAISAGVTDYLQKEGGTQQYAILANRIANVVEGARSRSALAERKRRLETLISNLPGIVYRCRNERGWPMEVVEGECRELTGYDAAALESDEVVWGDDVLHPGDSEPIWGTVQDALDSGESFEVTYRIVTASGETKWVWERGSGVYDGDGELVALEGFITDVTARKRREEELERTNALRSTLFDALPVGVLAENSSREVITANRRMFELFEFSGEPTDIVGADCAELVEEASHRFADSEAFLESVDELLDERDSDATEFELTDGRTFRRIYRPIEFADGDGHLWVYQDVTARSDYERELDRFESILEASGDPVYTLDERGHFTFVNDTLLRTTGYDEEELLGEHVSVVLDSDGIDRAKGHIRSLLSSGDQRRTIELEFRTAAGETIPCELHLSILPFEEEFRGTVGVVRNITERVERERKLDRLRDRTQALMYAETRTETAEVAAAAAHDVIGAPLGGVYFVTDDGETIEPHAAIASLEGVFDEPPSYSRDAPDGSAAALVWDVFESGEPVRITDTETFEPLREERPVRSAVLHPLGRHGVFIASSDEPAAFGDTAEALVELLATSLRTALDRVEREAKLRRQRDELRRRNERLDRFASFVSHDLRNPLSVAIGHLELAREEHEADGHLDAVAGAHDRMDALIDDILTVARQGDEATDLSEVDLETLAADCWRGVETAEATLETETDETLLADRGRLQQAMENLVRNAVEHAGDDVTVTVGDLDDGFYVEDDGDGIRLDDHEEVFEPGTSTAPDGTGFGLAIVKSVATAHGWAVDAAESESGGARFEFTDVESV